MGATPTSPERHDGFAHFLLRSTPSYLRLGICLVALLLFSAWRGAPDSRIDLVPTYVAARLADDGRFDAVYRPPMTHDEAAWQAWLAKGAQLDITLFGVGPFTNHPYYLSVARPLARYVDFDTFKKGMVFLNRFCVAWIGLEIVALLGATNLAAQLLLTLVLISCSPVISTIELGQNTLLALALALAALRSWSSSPGTKGLLLGATFAAMAWACKPWCALFLPVCFAFRRARDAACACAVVALVMLVGPRAVYPGAMVSGYSALTQDLTRVTVDAGLNLSSLVVLKRLTGPERAWIERYYVFDFTSSGESVRWAAMALALVIAVVAVVGVRARRPAAAWITGAALALALVPLSVSWTHYFVFALPLALMASFGSHTSSPLRIAGCALLAQLVVLHYWLFASGVPSSPWLTALPVASVVVVSWLALWFGPCADGSRRVASRGAAFAMFGRPAAAPASTEARRFET